MQNQAHSAASTYREDIDGMRAIAVSAVVIFHLVHWLIPQGFLGVDIFFVISGYLITNIIWREAREGRFSFISFYERRLRRLAPALLVVVAVTTIASVLILLPADLIGYGRSVVAGLFFFANIYFWRDTGYFSRTAEEKPLLHLWSLSVEEQFYLFFPVIILVIARFLRFTLPVIWILSLGSLALNIYMLRIGGGIPAFYLLPTRAWELGAGALVALHGAPLLSSVVGRPIRMVAFLLVAFGLFYSGPWPTILPVALPVVIGTAMLIWVGAPTRTWVGQALAWRPVNFLGKISYSLYLVHWPLIVLPKYYLVRDLTGWEATLIAFIAVALGAASWRYVEQPFRTKEISFGHIGAWAGGGVMALSLVAGVLIYGQGLPTRLSPEATLVNQSVGTHFRCAVFDLRPFGASRACDMTLDSVQIKDAKVVLMGNSHAQMYAPLVKALLEAAETTPPSVLVPINGCLPTVTVNISTTCLQAARDNLNEILGLEKLEHVIIALNWPVHRVLFTANGLEIPAQERALALLAGIEDMSVRFAEGVKISVIGPIARPGFDIASVLSRQLAFGHTDLVDVSTPSPAFYAVFNPVLDKLKSNPRIQLIRPDQILCDETVCDFVKDGRSIYSDSNHIAEPALYLIAPAFEGF